MTNKASADTISSAVSLADEEGVTRVLVESVLGLWDVVNNLTRLKPTRRERYRVTIFGSARTQPGSFGYEETRRTAAALAAMGCDIITGGGPGLMQAANEGAASSERAQSIGHGIAFGSSVAAGAMGSGACAFLSTRFSALRHHGVTPSTCAGSMASPRRGMIRCAPAFGANSNNSSAGWSHACIARQNVPQCTGRNAPPPSIASAFSAFAGPRWMSPHTG